MRLVRAGITEIDRELAAPASNARQLWQRRRGLLFIVEDELGQRGQGEASPLPGYSPDTAEACRAALDGFDCRQVHLDPSRALPPQVSAVVERIDERLPAARFALETALLDWASRRMKLPLWSLLSGRAQARPVALSSLLLGETESALVDEAMRAVGRGVRTLKWKIGRPDSFARELVLLRALRRAVGEEVALRLDANGALDPQEARRQLAALSEFSPELVEEPVAGALATFSSSLVPLAADESLQIGERLAGASASGSPSSIDRLAASLQSGACRYVVLKPMALGGAIHCLDLARRAAIFGAQAMVSHLFDGPVGLTAAAALALALPEETREKMACGVDAHPGLSAWPEVALPFLDGGWIRPWSAPGLGFDCLVGEGLSR